MNKLTNRFRTELISVHTQYFEYLESAQALPWTGFSFKLRTGQSETKKAVFFMARRPRRPLSPHLQIYRPQLTSVLSNAHRLTGLFLFFAACVWTVFLGALSGEGFSFLETGWGRILGSLFLVSFLGTLFYHLLNGVRHLLWNLGYGFDLSRVHQSGKAVLGEPFF